MSGRRSSRNILFVSNQGGLSVVELKCQIAAEMEKLSSNISTRFAVLTREEAKFVRTRFPGSIVESFEEFSAEEGYVDYELEKYRVVAEYPDTNWTKVLLSERSFFDVSNLHGGAGERKVSKDYVDGLLVRLIRFFEHVLRTSPDLVVAQTPDSLMTLVLYNVARNRNLTLRGLCPAWITPGRHPAGFLVEDEFLHSPVMLRTFNGIASRSLTQDEVHTADSFRSEISRFDANAVYKAVTGVEFGRSALSPNLWRLVPYLFENYRRDPDVHYFKIGIASKVHANIKRVFRKVVGKLFWGKQDPIIPKRSVFFPFHFQPEASTLVGGLDYADQAATAESILRALPFGWSLVIKEHPAARGIRPISHYRRLRKYPNVVFSDAPSKAILSKVDAVVTVTGTIGIEAIALDKPVIILGRWFWDFCPLVYKCQSAASLSVILRSVLVDEAYDAQSDRQDQVRRFLTAYLSALVPASPTAGGARAYAIALISEVSSCLDVGRK